MNTILSPSAPAHFWSETTFFFSTRIASIFVRWKWTKWNQPDLHVLLASSKGRMSWGRWWNQLIGDLYRFFYHGDQMISWWRIWLSTSKSTCVVPAWPRRMLLLGSVPADDRSNWPLTPRDVHLFKMNCKLRGAWSDRDTNDIFAHCSLIFYFIDFKFSNIVCPSELHPLMWFFLKSSFRKKKNIRKPTQNALAPSIFIVLSIVLKLGTQLLPIQAQNTLLQNFQFRSRSRDMDEKPPKTLFYPTRSALTKHNFFRRSKLKNL